MRENYMTTERFKVRLKPNAAETREAVMTSFIKQLSK